MTDENKEQVLDTNTRILNIMENILKKLVNLEERIVLLENGLANQEQSVEIRMKAFMASLGGLLIESSKPKPPILELRATSAEEKIFQDTMIIVEEEGNYYVFGLVLPNGYPVPMSIENGQPVSPPVDAIIADIFEHLGDTKPVSLNEQALPLAIKLMEEKQTRLLLVNAYYNNPKPNLH